MNKVKIETSYSHYSTDVKKYDGTIIPDGTQFISVGIDGGTWGSGSPCDSKEEAIQSIKQTLEQEGLKEKDIEFTDTTGIISKSDLFGQNNLNRWFN